MTIGQNVMKKVSVSLQSLKPHVQLVHHESIAVRHLSPLLRSLWRARSSNVAELGRVSGRPSFSSCSGLNC